MVSRVAEYMQYHRESLKIKDIDPSYPALKYICDRFELNVEQRYWLAFLYSCCYCVPTVYYIYNEFPDFETVDVARLQRRRDANKQKLLFQTDRRWIKMNDQFVETFLSYRDIIGPIPQRVRFKTLQSYDKFDTYRRVFKEFSKLKYFGRYSLFLFTEAVFVGLDL